MQGLGVWGHCFRWEVREGSSEEVTLSEKCMISRRQQWGREKDGQRPGGAKSL